jgi:hypothetical protein
VSGSEAETEAEAEAEADSYVKTDFPSASLSWNKAPIWGLRPDSFYCETVAGLLMWNALSDERTGLASAVILGSGSRGSRDHILLSEIRDFPFCHFLRLAGSRLTYSTPPEIGRVF